MTSMVRYLFKFAPPILVQEKLKEEVHRELALGMMAEFHFKVKSKIHDDIKY